LKTNSVIVALVVLTSIAFSSIARADRDDDYDDHDKRSGFSSLSKRATVSPLYQKECGSCHLAFPARFIGANGWKKIMTTLDDHFGDNAELDKADADRILAYLEANAARESRWGWGREKTSLRISENRHFQREHDEVPRGVVGVNAKIKSFSDCQACHQRADKGSFRESEISIPGFKSWDD